ncbi:POK8 protein, partial [Locustella ochotensis]|nr:POK8 protein [Locustella ochotensis]
IRALEPLRREMKDTIIYHYVDDILFCQKSSFTSSNSENITLTLTSKGLIIAPEKVQQKRPWNYLGWTVYSNTIHPKKVTLHTDISTLHDAQRLFGDLQWVRTIVGITNDDLQPFLPWLHGSDANSPQECTPEQQKALVHVSEKLQ